mgnify:CR=1 FL=1
MATESPLIHDGAQTILGFGALNNSTWLGSTAMAGPSGSGQFLAVRLSTTAARTVLLASTATTGVPMYGVLQNKGSTGLVADVGIFGITKAVAGATIGIGGVVEVSSTAPGTMWTSSSPPPARQRPSASGRKPAIPWPCT